MGGSGRLLRHAGPDTQFPRLSPDNGGVHMAIGEDDAPPSRRPALSCPSVRPGSRWRPRPLLTPPPPLGPHHAPARRPPGRADPGPARPCGRASPPQRRRQTRSEKDRQRERRPLYTLAGGGASGTRHRSRRPRGPARARSAPAPAPAGLCGTLGPARPGPGPRCPEGPRREGSGAPPALGWRAGGSGRLVREEAGEPLQGPAARAWAPGSAGPVAVAGPEGRGSWRNCPGNSPRRTNCISH